MIFEFIFFVFVAAAVAFLLLILWLRPAGPDTPGESSQQDVSPFPLARIAQRIFDPSDFAELVDFPDLRRPLVAERKLIAAACRQRARQDVSDLLAAHRVRSGFDESATFANECRVLWIFIRLRVSIAMIVLVCALAGPQNVAAVFQSIRQAAMVPQLHLRPVTAPEGAR